MTMNDYERATEIIEEIRECKYRINQFIDLVESNPYEIGLEGEDLQLHLKGWNEGKLYVQDLRDIILELEEEFSEL